MPRFDPCPAGEKECGGVCTQLGTEQNCAGCGDVCPGAGATAEVACVAQQCTLTCRGDSFDVDGNPNNGCEQLDTGGGHTQGAAVSRGYRSCSDLDSQDQFSGKILSDARVHTNPAVTGFDSVVGAAPDWWSVFATGGLCTNDPVVTITTMGGGPTICYRLTVQTNLQSQSVDVSGNGSDTITMGSGAYSDDTTILFKIEKTCPLPIQEAVNYTVSYHL